MKKGEYPNWNKPTEIAKYFFEHERDKPLSFVCGNPYMARKWRAVPMGRLFRIRLLEELIKKTIEHHKEG